MALTYPEQLTLANDIPELKKHGVAEVFTPSTPAERVVEFIRDGAARTAA